MGEWVGGRVGGWVVECFRRLSATHTPALVRHSLKSSQQRRNLDCGTAARHSAPGTTRRSEALFQCRLLHGKLFLCVTA